MEQISGELQKAWKDKDASNVKPDHKTSFQL